MMIAFLMLAQAATTPAPAAPAPEPRSWSILAPPNCPATNDDSKTIVVCGTNMEQSARLPLPDERGPPNHGVPSNPNLTGVGALAIEGTPCAATQWGCQVGVGPPIVPMIKGAVGLAKSAFAKKPDKTGRVSIDLSDPAPAAATAPASATP